MAVANRKTRKPDPVLIRAKFSRPPGQPEFVERSRLFNRLDRTLRHQRVILVSAPPGISKTTLVTQWLARQRDPVAWLALDRSDSDPERFGRYLVAAVNDSVGWRDGHGREAGCVS